MSRHDLGYRDCSACDMEEDSEPAVDRYVGLVAFGAALVLIILVAAS